MRVLLVEDDPSTQRFVALALEDLPVQLQTCDSVARALELLRAGQYALILTDLMLRGESALELLAQLSRQPQLLGAARVAVYSAGLTAERRAQLAQWGVWRMLDKPVPLRTLRDCVADAMPAPPPRDEPGAPVDAADAQASAIATYFAGNRALYLAFRASCLAQFGQDAASARRALADRDAAHLHRLGHSLKTVLLTLGQTAASGLAREAELAARDADWPAMARLWPSLIEQLERLHQGT